MTYQKPDAALIDYGVYQYGRMNQLFRGPEPDFDGEYVACIGGAQTFGRYVGSPYPALLGERLETPVANLGTGGAGPGFYLRDSMVLEACSNAKLCVVQVMSARSLSNRLFKVKKKRNAQLKAVSKAMQELFPHIDFETFSYAHNMLNQVAEADPEKFAEVEAEMKTAWVARTRLLLESIYTRKILLWFSERTPDATTRHRADKAMLKYPHFVDRAMMDAVAPFADEVVEVVSSAGMPQPLTKNGEIVLSTPWGVPIAENRYYPSPEMHAEAAEALEPAARRLLTA